MYQLPAKMAAITICNETSVSDLKTRLRHIYRVIESYRWIIEAYVSVICFVHIFLFLFSLSLFLPVELSLDLKSVFQFRFCQFGVFAYLAVSAGYVARHCSFLRLV